MISAMARTAETNKESFDRELGRLRNARTTGKTSEDDFCTLQFSSESGNDELDLIREKRQWYYSTLTKRRRNSNERNASAYLKMLATAQVDFRHNDRDGDGVQNFWVRDVAGLYGIETRGKPIKLTDIRVAGADRSSGRGAYKAMRESGPLAGYHFAALKKYVIEGEARPYDNGTGRNPTRFGIAAVPAEYGRYSRKTFIVDHRNVVWARDIGGKIPDLFPRDPAKAGWTRIR